MYLPSCVDCLHNLHQNWFSRNDNASAESTTPQFRTSAWLFSDGSAPVERSTGQSAPNRLT